jgi:hypothetical protein
MLQGRHGQVMHPFFTLDIQDLTDCWQHWQAHMLSTVTASICRLCSLPGGCMQIYTSASLICSNQHQSDSVCAAVAVTTASRSPCTLPAVRQSAAQRAGRAWSLGEHS